MPRYPGCRRDRSSAPRRSVRAWEKDDLREVAALRERTCRSVVGSPSPATPRRSVTAARARRMASSRRRG